MIRSLTVQLITAGALMLTGASAARGSEGLQLGLGLGGGLLRDTPKATHKTTPLSVGTAELFLGWGFGEDQQVSLGFALQSLNIAHLTGDDRVPGPAEDVEGWSIGPRIGYRIGRFKLWTEAQFGEVSRYLSDDYDDFENDETDFSTGMLRTGLGLAFTMYRGELVDFDVFATGHYVVFGQRWTDQPLEALAQTYGLGFTFRAPTTRPVAVPQRATYCDCGGNINISGRLLFDALPYLGRAVAQGVFRALIR